LGDKHVDNLAMFVYGPVYIPPRAGDFHVGLINKPPLTNRVPAWACGINQRRSEALNPSVDRDVVYLNASFG
jgi:hypothetical protein